MSFLSDADLQESVIKYRADLGIALGTKLQTKKSKGNYSAIVNKL